MYFQVVLQCLKTGNLFEVIPNVASNGLLVGKELIIMDEVFGRGMLDCRPFSENLIDPDEASSQVWCADARNDVITVEDIFRRVGLIIVFELFSVVGVKLLNIAPFVFMAQYLYLGRRRKAMLLK